MHAREMLATHPHVQGNTNDALIRCIEACADCWQACTACADACLGEDMLDRLTQCIRLNLNCADCCVAAAALASRRTGSHEALLRTMLEACRDCGEECEQHATQHEHCTVCARICRACEESCREAAASTGKARAPL